MSECRIDVHYRNRLMDLEEALQEAACENECLKYELMTAKAETESLKADMEKLKTVFSWIFQEPDDVKRP